MYLSEHLEKIETRAVDVEWSWTTKISILAEYI